MIPARSTRAGVWLAALLLLVPAAARAQEHHHPEGQAEQIGTVSFPTTCGETAAATIERGVAMLHSFWFEAAERAFRQAAEQDPRCAMAQWGIAMTRMGNPMTRLAPPPEQMEAGRAAARRAAELVEGASARERAYVAAVVAYYEGEDVEHMARARAHEEALAALHRAHPDDPEATIFYARAVVANAPPSDLTFARQLEGAALLQPLFEQQPQHPGLAHYIIHAYDAPALAERGSAAAFAYAEIAPSAPHALHMPSHIFTRLGYWDESIETNTRSARAEPDSNAAVHPMDYMVYAYLQQGRDAEAGAVVARATELPDRYYGGVMGYNFAAMPARYALERGDWATAAALAVPTAGPAYVRAVTRFARGIGAARSGSAEAARAEAEALGALETELAADAYWSTVVGAQRLAVEAWAAHAAGDAERAVQVALQAAEREETVEKHPVTPGPLLPARELAGDLLLAVDRPAEALEAYAATLAREPRRARALHGAAVAAERAGRPEEARRYFTELLEVMERADAARDEPAAARRFLTASP